MTTMIGAPLLAAKTLVILAIALILSLAITLLNFGLTEGFILNWSKGLLVALIVIPFGLRLIPIVGGVVRALLGECPVILQRCVIAICVAAIMESLVSLFVTLAQRGLAPDWSLMWASAFLKALPIGLLIGFTMTFIVQPWMQRLAVQGKLPTAGRKFS